MIIRVKRKTAQITVKAVIIFVALAVIFSLTFVHAGTSNIQKLPNMPVGQKSADIINVGNSQFNVSWEHINTYNLTKQEFILKVSQTNNSQTKNQIVTINPYLYLTDANFNLSNLPAGSIETTAYQYAPQNYVYWIGQYNQVCSAISNSTNSTNSTSSTSSVPAFQVYSATQQNAVLYSPGDEVNYNGELYQCQQTIYNYNGLPSALPQYWKDLGAYTQTQTNLTWNYPNCTSSGQIVGSYNQTFPATLSTDTQNYPTGNWTGRWQKTYTIYSPVQIGSSSMNSTASMFKGSKTVQNYDGSLTQLSNMSMYQLEVPAYSNTSQGTKYFKITINNIPINRTNGIHSTGTFLADIGGNLIWDKTHSSWWNTNYSHYVKLTMTTNPGNITYYNFTSANFSNNIKSDFSDVIPIALDNSTMYNFTRESYSSGNWATFRINNLGATSFYLYYNDSNAIYQGNVSNVYYNPVAMYYMDELSGSTAHDALGQNNGSISGATVGQMGKIDKSYSFAGTSSSAQYVNLGNSAVFSSLTPSTPFTIVADFKSSSSTIQWITARDTGQAGGNQYRLALNYGGAGVIEFDVGTTSVTYAGSGYDDGNWHQVAGKNTGSASQIYVDGSYIGNGGHGTNTASTNTLIASRASHTYGFNGNLDEIKFYSRDLTDAQIKALSNQTTPTYTIGAEQSQSVPVPSNITITLNSPINNYNSSVNYILTNGTVTSTYPIANLSVWTNITGTWALNQTNTSVVTNNSAYTFNLTNIPDGTYKLAYQSYDNQSVGNFSENRTFTVDTTKPTVTILYPTPGSYGYLVTQLNYSATDTHLSKCWYSIDSGTNSTPNSCNANFTISVADGSHTAIVYANDTFGNVGSASVTFIQDTTPPTITLISPTNGTSSTNLTQTFIANETDNINLSNATLHIYNSTGEVFTPSGRMCYQESANTTNQTGIDGNCGLNYSGSYSDNGISASILTPGWYSQQDINNLYDGNWSTSGIAFYDNGKLNITYDIPNGGQNSSKWTLYNDSSSSIVNVSIPQQCWNSTGDNTLKFNIFSNNRDGYVDWSCYNSINQKVLIYHDSYSGDFYEEAMWWNVSTGINPTTKQISGTSNQTSWNVTLPNYGNYTWNVQSCDQVGNCNTSSNYTFEVLTGSTCIYSGSGNWNISLGDYCVIDTNTNLGLNNITFYGTGNVTLNATITTCNIGGLPANQIGYIGSNALINYGVCV